MISGRTAETCEPVAKALQQEGREAMAIPCHIARREEVDALIEKTRQHWGRIDVLVLNAAVNPYYGAMSGLTDDVFDKVIATNVRSNLWLAKLVHPEMAERRDGVIIIISEHRSD